MENLIDEQVKQLKIFIMKCFKESGKKHLLITGRKKIGKTTVLNEILKDEKSIGGIITYAVRDDKISPKYVVLNDINDSNNNGIIAVRNEICNALLPQISAFDILGVNILNKYMHSTKDIIVIDEIGFLENDAIIYQNEILKCFEEKKVYAVLRKENTAFISKLIKRHDAFTFDINDAI